MKRIYQFMALVGLKTTPTSLSIVYGGAYYRSLLENEDIILEKQGSLHQGSYYLKCTDLSALDGVRWLLGGHDVFVLYPSSYAYLWVLE